MCGHQDTFFAVFEGMLQFLDFSLFVFVYLKHTGYCWIIPCVWASGHFLCCFLEEDMIYNVISKSPTDVHHFETAQVPKRVKIAASACSRYTEIHAQALIVFWFLCELNSFAAADFRCCPPMYSLGPLFCTACTKPGDVSSM